METDQPNQAIHAYGMLGKIGVKAVKPFLKDPVEEGCRPALFAAASPDIAKEGLMGVYIVPDRKITEVSDMGRDEALGERLWGLSVEVLREKLGGDLGYEFDV